MPPEAEGKTLTLRADAKQMLEDCVKTINYIETHKL